MIKLVNQMCELEIDIFEEKIFEFMQKHERLVKELTQVDREIKTINQSDLNEIHSLKAELKKLKKELQNLNAQEHNHLLTFNHLSSSFIKF